MQFTEGRSSWLSVDVIEGEQLVRNAAEVGGYLRQGLAGLADRHAAVGDVRGNGLLLGIETTTANAGAAEARERRRRKCRIATSGCARGERGGPRRERWKCR